MLSLARRKSTRTKRVIDEATVSRHSNETGKENVRVLSCPSKRYFKVLEDTFLCDLILVLSSTILPLFSLPSYSFRFSFGRLSILLVP